MMSVAAGSGLAHKHARLSSSDDKDFIYRIEDRKENLEKIQKHTHKHAHKKADRNT
jgi:hypothetical protein